KPNIPTYESIDYYHDRDLIALALWVMSDGLLRTDEEIAEQMFKELPFKRRGERIRQRLHQAVKAAKSQLDG
ncbi:MAG: hypothetical protein RMM31_02455, partial [Anaerolineae bacterium]|nr:hypothetical protein [Anaerolineae bacterium]